MKKTNQLIFLFCLLGLMVFPIVVMSWLFVHGDSADTQKKPPGGYDWQRVHSLETAILSYCSSILVNGHLPDSFDVFSLSPNDWGLLYNDQIGSITDAWATPFVIISCDGKFSALGSCGPNQIWEYGSNDDVIYVIEGPRVVYGPWWRKTDVTIREFPFEKIKK